MPRTKTRRTRKPLSDAEVEKLAGIICAFGDDPASKSAALLVLMDAIERAEQPADIATVVKVFAFGKYGAHDTTGMIDAQVDLLRGKLPLSFRPD